MVPKKNTDLASFTQVVPSARYEAIVSADEQHVDSLVNPHTKAMSKLELAIHNFKSGNMKIVTSQ